MCMIMELQIKPAIQLKKTLSKTNTHADVSDYPD